MGCLYLRQRLPLNRNQAPNPALAIGMANWLGIVLMANANAVLPSRIPIVTALGESPVWMGILLIPPVITSMPHQNSHRALIGLPPGSRRDRTYSKNAAKKHGNH